MAQPVSTASKKKKWVRPGLKILEAGSAESQRGPNPDGGGGFQGS